MRFRQLFNTLSYIPKPILEVVADDIWRIVAPIWCWFIRIYRRSRNVNLKTGSVVTEHRIITYWWSYRLAIDLFKRGTTTKCIPSNPSDTIGDSYTYQRGASFECIISNRSNTIRNSYICQRGATRECIISNCSNVIGDDIGYFATSRSKCYKYIIHDKTTSVFWRKFTIKRC